LKYLSRIMVTDTLKNIGKGLGSSAPESGYSWYAGIGHRLTGRKPPLAETLCPNGTIVRTVRTWRFGYDVAVGQRMRSCGNHCWSRSDLDRDYFPSDKSRSAQPESVV